jgi:hypothetical protein
MLGDEKRTWLTDAREHPENGDIGYQDCIAEMRRKPKRVKAPGYPLNQGQLKDTGQTLVALQTALKTWPKTSPSGKGAPRLKPILSLAPRSEFPDQTDGSIRL